MRIVPQQCPRSLRVPTCPFRLRAAPAPGRREPQPKAARSTPGILRRHGGHGGVGQTSPIPTLRRAVRSGLRARRHHGEALHGHNLEQGAKTSPTVVGRRGRPPSTASDAPPSTALSTARKTTGKPQDQRLPCGSPGVGRPVHAEDLREQVAVVLAPLGLRLASATRALNCGASQRFCKEQCRTCRAASRMPGPSSSGCCHCGSRSTTP